MRIRRFVISILLAFSFPHAVHAGGPDLSVRELYIAHLPADGFTSRASRDTLVRAAGKYCASFGRKMPRNSPAEDQWLLAEIGGDGDRPERALRSPEWGRRMAANFLSGCEAFVNAYWIPGQETKALVGLAWTFSRFESDAEKAMRDNRVDTVSYPPSVLKWSVTGFLSAALVTMD